MGASPPDGIKNTFNLTHCLSPGSYFVRVNDKGNDAFSNTAPYSITFTAEDEPDQNEPNDSKETATTAGTGLKGAIACAGDADYYKVTVGQDKLLRVHLAGSKTSSVDLKYTVLRDESGTLREVQSKVGENGLVQAIDIEEHYAMPPGEYFIRVEDVDGDEGDATLEYTIDIETPDEQDRYDVGTRNDTPATATARDRQQQDGPV